MLTAFKQGFWGRSYVVRDETGQAIAELSVQWGGNGTIKIGPRTIRITPQGWFTRTWTARSQGNEIAKIGRPEFFARQYVIDLGLEKYRVVPRFFSSSADVFRGEKPLGSLIRHGWMRPVLEVNLPDEMDIAVRCLAVWTLILIWRIRSNTAAAS